MKINLRSRCRTLVKVVGVVSACYICMLVVSNGRNSNTTQQINDVPIVITGRVQRQATSHHHHQQQQQYYNSFNEALRARADPDRYIMLVMIDETFTDMALNFHEASLHAHSVNNFLFVGLGRNACQILHSHQPSIACFHYADDPDAGRPSSYGQREFRRKMNVRTDMILDALTANFSVIHSDTDVAFLSNPLKRVKVIIALTGLAANKL